MTVEFMFDATDGVWTLDPNYPAASDTRKEGDDHIRGLKLALTQTFPAVSAPITASHTEINYLDGVTGNVQTQLDAKLASTAYTAADVLTKLLTVDVDDAGINATTINSVTLAELAQLSSADFTALQVGGADVATEAYADAVGPESSDWIDIANPISGTSGVSTATAHTLSGEPDTVFLRLVCLTAEGNWSVDDVCHITSTYDQGGAIWYADATNVTVIWNDINILNKTSAAGTNVTSANWKLQFKAVKF